MINWLQNWYKNQCNGDWEHDYGIKIETLDNPGWSVAINLQNTSSELAEIQWKFLEVSETNWLGFKIEENIFSGSGDPEKLELIIYIFQQLYMKNEISDSKILSMMI